MCLVQYAVCCTITTLSFKRVSGWTLNRISNFLTLCLQASRFPLDRVKESPRIQAKYYFSGRVTLQPGTELWLVSFNKRHQNEEAFFQKHSWRAHVSSMFPSFPCGKHCFQCQVLFPRCKLCLRYTAGNFNENPSVRAVANILRTRASEHSNCCEQFNREHFQIQCDHSIPLLGSQPVFLLE